ncbi:hypothetical protein JHS3_04310 [Jeongeupia sp. HS-3]|uniref:hypothetical protein n=1 Tax=Jeongeupia sp. HS-3 TaxID=1009682 RepID=UPI0018A53EBB|nr:hypothetical protein [Jeongeupia sp. HS-3]BCL74695.1 hypothetical protein JHS3_04310 [Jeongeupia sp. HS-3]
MSHILTPEFLAQPFPALSRELVEAAPGEFLIDEIHPGAPLVISFAFVDWAGNPGFYGWGRTRKLADISGQPINRILLRDRRSQWYQQGVAGLGDNVDETIRSLQVLIDLIRPSRITTLGESMGAYGAIHYGVMLGAARIAAFGPLSHLQVDEALLYNDRRWLPVMQALAANPPEGMCDDLAGLLRERHYRGELHLGFGTDAGGANAEAVCLDAVHALRLAAHPSVQLHPYPQAQHTVTLYLKENRLLDGFLECALLG